MKCGKLLSAVLLIVVIFSAISQLNASIVVLNGLTHENSLQKGETYRGTIQLQNTANTEKSARIYIRDYWFSHSGESKHDPAGTLERSNAGWITFNPELATLKGGEIITVNYEVRVPETDSLRGTYWSVIMVEGVLPPDTTNLKMGVKINTAIRYAIQIVTTIGNSGTSDMQFIGLDLEKENDKNILKIAIENTGECVLRPEMNLELFDESGISNGIIKAERRKIFPGTSTRATIDLEGIKPGTYNGVLIADCGDDRMFGTNLSLEIK